MMGSVEGGRSPLENGNYVVRSLRWRNGGAIRTGAVTFGDGTTGVSGPVNAANSLVGSTGNDEVGSEVIALKNGNYLVVSSEWDNGGVSDAGAVTFGDGTTGVSGPVSAANSLVGSSVDDQVGSNGVTELVSGNYVVSSSEWNNGGVSKAWAFTFGDGTTGVSGPVSTANSLVGSTGSGTSDGSGVTALQNGNYVVSNGLWDNGGNFNVGAVTFGNGTTGVSGTVSAANSLVGSTAGDFVGGYGVVALENGNYVVNSRSWDNGGVSDAGAVTFGDGITGISGPVSVANSLVGSTVNDQVGFEVTALENGHYVVSSFSWDNGGASNAGAVTFGDGTTGVSGPVSAGNSLIGSTSNDNVGSFGLVALENGNYVVISIGWNHDGESRAGAVTFGDGTTGVSGPVSAANSLVGSTANDQVGSFGVTELENGNYVVNSIHWANGGAPDAGAVTFGNGTTGVSGPVSAANSLVGSSAFDRVGLEGVAVLKNGNYLVRSSGWDNGGVSNAGAVTFGDGTTGVSGQVSLANSLVGSTANDQVGSSGITASENGNYVVSSNLWDNGAAVDAGAVSFGDASVGGAVGEISLVNSVFGQVSSTNLQDVVVDGNINNFYAPFVDEVGGRVRVGSQASGFPIAPTGDFDTDDDIDGGDFLAWQRGFATQYDAGDLTDWQTNYGQPTTLAASSAATGAVLTALTSDDTLATRVSANETPTDGAFLLWLDEEDRAAEPAILEETRTTEATSADVAFELPALASATDSETGDRFADDDSEAETIEQEWLSKELLERVFGS